MCDYHLFRDGIRPMWEVRLVRLVRRFALTHRRASPKREVTGSFRWHSVPFTAPPPQDESNKHGGRWVIKLRKGVVSRMWENLVLAVIGDQVSDHLVMATAASANDRALSHAHPVGPPHRG